MQCKRFLSACVRGWRCLHSPRLRRNIPFLLGDPAVHRHKHTCAQTHNHRHTHSQTHIHAHNQMAATCALRTLLSHPQVSLLVTYDLWGPEFIAARYTDRMLLKALITALLILCVSAQYACILVTSDGILLLLLVYYSVCMP